MRIKELLTFLMLLLTSTAEARVRPNFQPLDLPKRSPAAAFAGFHREEMRIMAPPYTAVGRLKFSGHLWCTATLIGRDLILTAAHCLFDENHRFRRTKFRFTPATWMNHTDSSLADKFWWGTNNVVAHPELDFAVLRLEKPLGDTYGWMHVQPKGSAYVGRSLEIVSYSDDFKAGARATYQKDCGFTFYPWSTPSRAYKLLGHSCAGFDGASGAGMFYITGGQAHILGVNVRGSRDGCTQGPKRPCQVINYNQTNANGAVPTDNFWPWLQKILAEQRSE